MRLNQQGVLMRNVQKLTSTVETHTHTHLAESELVHIKDNLLEIVTRFILLTVRKLLQN